MADGAAAQVDALAELWRWWAGTIGQDYSPLYLAIAQTVATDRELLGLVAETPPAAHNPPNLLAAAHYLLLGGVDHPLADVFDGRSEAPVAPLFRDLCLSHRKELLEVMAVRRVQTNEVGRSALIGPALTWAARAAGEPVQLVDVGCSAGLNLFCDRYLLDYGALGTMGPPDAAVRVECTVEGGAPPIGARLPPIAGRIGIDLDPPDLADPDDARWLLACIWPDTGRLERTALAIEIAAADPPPVCTGDAVALLPDVLGGVGPGLAVVVNTWSYAYLMPDQRQAYVEALRRVARTRPVMWIAGDSRGVVSEVDTAGVTCPSGWPECEVLTAVHFDGNEEHALLLAVVQAHGRWIDWRA